MIDVEALDGPSATALVEWSAGVRNSLDSFMFRVADRAVATNQHKTDGVSDPASWLGSKAGTSTKKARKRQATQKKMRQHPKVENAADEGRISADEAEAIIDGADGDDDIADQLLNTAAFGSVDDISEKAQAIKAASDSRSRRDKLRQSQYIRLDKRKDSMVWFEGLLLPEIAAPLLSAYRRASGSTAWARAEAFATALGDVGKQSTQVVFHVDATPDGTMTSATMEGVGPVGISSVFEVLHRASLAFIGTVGNKLERFGEQDRRSTSKDLPEFVKRAVHAYYRGTCATPGCTNVAAQIDHITARTNGGPNDTGNLQALCAACHAQKTQTDAPWTRPGIYAKAAERKQRQKAKPPPPSTEMFPNTG